MSNSISVEQFKKDLRELEKRVDDLKSEERKADTLRFILKGISALLLAVAPLVKPEYKLASLLFSAVGKIVDIFLKSKE